MGFVPRVQVPYSVLGKLLINSIFFPTS
ncbi:unnamed protein product [Bemisia tabaci]|uniref:Uncharacterized protein n=1 Tax=Bemisia tabaci TaxID=7038 RepID=A0A9P0F2R8_BEMTA|nr:unnamed protein product [Bemisia tabaci]